MPVKPHPRKKIIAPPERSCEWSWIAGASIGELNDFDEAMYTLHAGKERTCPGSNHTDAFYLEVGLTSTDESMLIRGLDNPINYDIDIIPITLNYKREYSLTSNLNYYLGAGAGVAITDIKLSSASGSNSADETSFYGHIFAGIVYDLNERFEIFGGARYIFMDGQFPSLGSVETDLDGDVLFEIGARLSF